MLMKSSQQATGTSLSHPDYDLEFLRMRDNDDRNAFKVLFDAFYPPLCAFCRNYILEHATIEDIVQDVYVRLWENRKQITVNSSIRNYLLTMAKKRCINYVRSIHTKAGILSSINKCPAPKDTFYTEELLTVSELSDLLDKVLQKMPEPYRKAFEMSQMENQRTGEIAIRLNVSERTAERYREKAFQILRLNLKRYYPLALPMLILNQSILL